jgi:hypothetical protein
VAGSPAEMPCAACAGHGRLAPDYRICPACDCLGRVWRPGGPLFGCQMTIGERSAGEIVTLGTGERCRIVKHSKTGTPSTFVYLIDEFFDTEERYWTVIPSQVGVRSVAVTTYTRSDPFGRASVREDHLDPLQRRIKAL